MEEVYMGPYSGVNYEDVKELLHNILLSEEYSLFISEDNEWHDQIHNKAMNQAYEIYEKYQSGVSQKDLHYISVTE